MMESSVYKNEGGMIRVKIWHLGEKKWEVTSFDIQSFSYVSELKQLFLKQCRASLHQPKCDPTKFSWVHDGLTMDDRVTLSGDSKC